MRKEYEPKNLQRQVDLAVANHAAEISTPIPHVSEHLEAAHIDIAAGEDPWETNYLGSFVLKIRPETASKRAARKPGEISASFGKTEDDSKKMIGSYCLIGDALDSIVERAKTIWKNLGIPKTDRANQIQKIIDQNSQGRGKDIETRISSLPKIQPISPVWVESGGED